MQEWTIILLLTSGVALWCIGGKTWKGYRRYVWPVVAAICSVSSGVSLVRGVLLALGLVGVNSLPYGNRTPWAVRVLVFAALPLPALILAPQIAVVVIPLTTGFLGLMMWLSKKFNFVTWKIFEGLAGLLQASSIIMAILL